MHRDDGNDDDDNDGFLTRAAPKCIKEMYICGLFFLRRVFIIKNQKIKKREGGMN